LEKPYLFTARDFLCGKTTISIITSIDAASHCASHARQEPVSAWAAASLLLMEAKGGPHAGRA